MLSDRLKIVVQGTSSKVGEKENKKSVVHGQEVDGQRSRARTLPQGSR